MNRHSPASSNPEPKGADTGASFWGRIRTPGLTPAGRDIDRLAGELPKKWDVFSYKRKKNFLWVVFIGGTGTGKSTIFNALCGRTISDTGVERPKTYGPIAYASRGAALEGEFPFPSMAIRRLSSEESEGDPYSGNPGQLLVVEHARNDLSHLVLVDTPDLDSLELRNRQMVEDLYLLADLVVFVTSQEKYADDVPFRFLQRIHEGGKPYLVLLNKAEGRLASEEVLTSLEAQGLKIPRSRFWSLPYLAEQPSAGLHEGETFTGFKKALLQMLDKSSVPHLIENEKRRSSAELKRETKLLVDLLTAEQDAARKWLEHLEVFYKASCQRLFEEEERHLTDEEREYLQREVRKFYSKYDLLGKPRRFIAQIILSPLEALGILKRSPVESHEQALLRIREKIDLAPIQAAVESFNRSVLESLSPPEESSLLYRGLRDPQMALTREEIKKRVWEEQDKLVKWLEETFQKLAKGISKSKEWGIYSTSILWGGLVLSLEAAIGGGISILEAVLDSAIAPFVTKGSVELFAYHELQRIARDLGEQYRRGLTSAIREQRDRYKQCLNSLTTPKEILTSLQSLVDSQTLVG